MTTRPWLVSNSSENLRLRVDLAYDGTSFKGFAPNVGVETVAGRLGFALEKVLSHPVQITCAGRTDAGVHARGQVVTFDTSRTPDPERLRRSLDRLCGPEIAVTAVTPVADDFDARFSAISRTYRYSILNTAVADPLRRNVVWHLHEPLDMAAMNEAAGHFLGQHDFASFCRRHPTRSLVRQIRAAGWERDSDLLVFEIVASSFCHQMVRSLVGTMVDVGCGKRKASEVPAIIAAGDRHAAPRLAPPQGLCLWEVGY